MRMMEIAAVILLVVSIAGLPAAALGYNSLRHSGHDGEVITLTGAHGAWSHDTIRVKQGQRLRLRLISNDVVHGFMLKGYDIEIDEVYPGKEKVIDFVADEHGTFTFVCTVPCSPDHREMRGKLVVEPQGGQSVDAAPEQK
jgi:cytochrome c oxidase subunit 2